MVSRPVIRLYDTRRRAVVPFRPRAAEATLYVCGVTPYDTTHLGHARTFLVFDVLVRLLELLALPACVIDQREHFRFVNAAFEQGDDVVLAGIHIALAAQPPRQAIDAAPAVQKDWAKRTAKERSQILRRWYDLIIANADDPLIVHVVKSFKGKVEYFGIDDKKLAKKNLQHATDSTYCLECGGKLSYEAVYVSHLGEWYCVNCKAKRPSFTYQALNQPLIGTYNIYNVLAAFYVAKQYKLSTQSITKALSSFEPVFGRQEVFEKDGKKIQVFLAKNPTGFNENLKTILDEKNVGTLVFVLNDRIPDGTDVSWVWDVDFELLNGTTIPVIATGDRAFDMGLRIKYSRGQIGTRTREQKKDKTTDGVIVEENLKDAIDYALSKTTTEKVCYILPTYSAMLETRKILSGRKIL